MKTIKLSVTGMSCEGCVDSVRNALERFEGVHNAEVSLDEKTAVLEVDDIVDANGLVRAVEAAGYQARAAD
jgi:Cu+-exporting ATPase